MNPLVHYVTQGWREGRKPNRLFDVRWYLDQHPDVRDEKTEPLGHYLEFGASEGRQAMQLFDVAWYRSQAQDCSQHENPLVHYTTHGWQRGLDPHPLFDAKFYAKIAGLPATEEPLGHFLELGRELSPHPLFDSCWYLNRNVDIAAAGANPLVHYVAMGASELRDPNPEFDAKWYVKEYAPPEEKTVSPLEHYVRSGNWARNLPTRPDQTNVFVNCKRQMLRHQAVWDGSREMILRAKLAKHDMEVSGVKASVIMPTRNRARCIAKAISSVLDQNHQNFELIIVDDGSVDDTHQIVESFGDPRIIYIRNEIGRGVSAARNIGLDAASGDWFFFLDSDNVWRSDFLQTMLKFVELRGVKSVYCAANIVGSGGVSKSVLYEDFDLQSCLDANFIDLNTFGVSHAFAELRFDEHLRRLVDWDYILKVAAETPIVGCPFIGVDYYDGDDLDRITLNEHNSPESLQELMGLVRQKGLDRWVEKCRPLQRGAPERVAVVFHAYHKEFISECLKYFRNVPVAFDLYVTTSHSLGDDAFREIRDEFDNAIFLQYPNVGSDIAPFLELVSTLSVYDLVCKVHTKRDAQRWGEVWRQNLMGSVLGSPELIKEIFNRFAADETILAAGGEAFYKLGDINSIPQTREHVSQLAKSTDHAHLLELPWSFFAGTVFWARPRAFAQLAKHACEKPSFSSEFQRDGGIEHAWERLLGMTLLQTDQSKVILTKGLADGSFDLGIVPATAGGREGITVTLDRLLAQNAKGGSKSSFATVRKWKVSTVIPTYNQREFIRGALESAIMQIGEFEHEILVSDDGSTDGTAEIVQEFVTKFPSLVRSIGNTENVGISANFLNCFQKATGDLIAMLEGDDYWLHPRKLADQVKFLEENSDCSMVFSKIEILDEKCGTRTPLERQERLMTSKLEGADFLADENMNLIANFSSCCFRADLMKTAPSALFEGRINEIAVAFYLERYGRIGFLNEAASVYRMHGAGVWSGSDRRTQLEGGLAARQMALKVAKPEHRSAIESIIHSKFSAPLAALDSG